MSIVQNFIKKNSKKFVNIWFQKSRLGLGTFKSRSRLDFLLKVSVSNVNVSSRLGLEEFGRDCSSNF